jgi:hypothetical protein
MAQSPNGIPSTNNSINSITRQAKTEPFDLQVARGQIYGHSTVSLFGYQSAVGNTTIPVWESATVYPAYLTTAATFYLYSSSASDSGAVILVNGLDANFNPISEYVTITGVTNPTGTTTKAYLRIQSLLLTTPASSQKNNVGTITATTSSTYAGITTGASGNAYAYINPTVSKSQMSVFTVPAGYTFYLDIAEVNTSNTYAGTEYLTYSVQAYNSVTGVALNVLQQPFVAIYTINRSAVPFAYTEKTDVQWRLSTSTSSTIAAGMVIAGKLISNGN